MKRGEVYWTDLAPRSGSEQRGRRPVIVLSNDVFNRAPIWKSTIVVPLSTSPSQAARGPSVVNIPAGAGGLSRASMAVCHQVTTLDRGKLGRRIGTLAPGLLREVEEALKTAMDLS